MSVIRSIALGVTCLCVSLVALSSRLPAQEGAAGVDVAKVDAAMARLAAEAAKVGNIIWYESSPADATDKIAAAFRKRFPALKLEHVRDTGGNSIAGRIVQESQGDTRTADVATSGATIMMPLKERNLMKEFDWRGFGLSADLAPTPYGVATTSVVYVIIYNSQLVKEADAPKAWTDLLDQRWEGKLGIWVRGEAQAGLAATWGVEKVADYIRKMNARRPVLLPSTFPLAQQVAAGELHVGLGLNHSAQIPLRRGAPLKIVVPEPVPISTLYSFVPSKARNPSGGALVALWLATPEGAKAYEDATDRGNPYIPGTKTFSLLKGHTLTQFKAEQAAEEAAAGARFNKMIESRELQ